MDETRPMSARDGLAIAVDGGNSKTDLALVRSDGELLAFVRGPDRKSVV